LIYFNISIFINYKKKIGVTAISDNKSVARYDAERLI